MAAGGVVAWTDHDADGTPTPTLGSDTRTKGVGSWVDHDNDGVATKVARS